MTGCLANTGGLIVSFLDETPVSGRLITALCLLFIVVSGTVLIRLDKVNLFNLSAVIMVMNFLFPLILYQISNFGKITFLYFLFLAPITYGAIAVNFKYLIGVFLTLIEYIVLICYFYYRDFANYLGGRSPLSLILAFSASYIFGAFLTLFFNLAFRDSAKKLKKIAYQDELTKFYNRRSFDLALEDKSLKSGAICDIDNFHNVNNTLGHQFGDLVLQTFSKVCLSYSCDELNFYRYGGEEFFALSRLTPDELAKTMNKIRKIFHKETKDITVSIGIASYEGKTAKEFVKEGDDNLYKSKNSGKNRVCKVDGTFLTD